MAKQKRTPARRVPKATEPRMYGDGKPSQTSETTQAPAQPAQPRTPVTTATPLRTPGARSAGATPRASAGASGSFGRNAVDKITDYRYVVTDLRRLGVVAAVILAILVVLGVALP